MPAPRTSLRALLVGDPSDGVEGIRLELCRHGFQVQARVIRTLEEFQAALEEGPWDVVLSDDSVPTLICADALPLVRAHDADLPFIVVTNRIGEDAAGEGLCRGAQDHVLTSNLRQLGPAVEREVREAANHRMQRSTQAELQAWNIPCGTRIENRKPNSTS